MKLIILLLLILLPGVFASAQTQLDSYITKALNNNEAIKQQPFRLTKNLYALKEARSLFFPSVSACDTQKVAHDGRTIDSPLGDLLNPVYKTLNQLTRGNDFRLLENPDELLNPDHFYDVRIRTTYPVLNAEIEYKRKMKAQQDDLRKIEIDLYKRELVREIKIAYYKYVQAGEAIGIYYTAVAFVKENLRVNTSFFYDQIINRTAIMRRDSEISRYITLLGIAQQTQSNAKAYFNFLLNENLHSAITSDSISGLPAGLFNYLAGVSLEVKNRHKAEQVRIDGHELQLQTDNTGQQLRLQLANSLNSFNAALAQFNAAKLQVASSQKYFNNMFRLYKEGQAIFIELLDAQSRLITARLQVNFSLFDTWIKAAEIERANAGYAIIN